MPVVSLKKESSLPNLLALHQLKRIQPVCTSLATAKVHSFQFLTMASPNDVSESLRCRYPSKRCNNLRSRKKNGELHSLCEDHRRKANENQRRLDSKRKAADLICDEASSSASSSPSPRAQAQVDPSSKKHRVQQVKQQQEEEAKEQAGKTPKNKEPVSTRCQYRSKPCDNPRAIKQNGDLHTFCEYHRQKANETQRRVEARRRASRRAEAQVEPIRTMYIGLEACVGMPHSVATYANSPTTPVTPGVVTPAQQMVGFAPPNTRPAAPSEALPDEDLALLQEFLFK